MYRKFSHYFTALVLGISLSGWASFCCAPVQAQIPDTTAEAKLIQMAREGDSEAVYNLALTYVNGDKVYTNYKEAAKLLEKAIADNYYPAYAQLAKLYLHGWGVAFDGQKAFDLYKKGAAHQDSYALYGLGVCYDYGIGTVPNFAMAKNYYTKAAQAGSYLGWCGLARLHTPERSPYANIEQKKKYCAQALQIWLHSDQKFFAPELRLALETCPQYLDKVIAKLERGVDLEAVVHSVGAAQYFSLCEALYARYNKVSHDVNDRYRAYNLASEAIDLEYLPARVALAQLLERRGDYEQASVVYKYIAAKGDLQSIIALANYAEAHPQEVDQDFWSKLLEKLKGLNYRPVYRLQAHYLILADPKHLTAEEVNGKHYLELLQKSADLGDGLACLELSDIYNSGKIAAGRWSIEPDQEKAFKYLADPLNYIYPLNYASQDRAIRFASLGDRYLYGKGTEANRGQAVACYERSLAVGYNDRAAYRLGSLLIKQNNQKQKERGTRLLQKVSQSKDSSYALQAAKLLKH